MITWITMSPLLDPLSSILCVLVVYLFRQMKGRDSMAIFRFSRNIAAGQRVRERSFAWHGSVFASSDWPTGNQWMRSVEWVGVITEGTFHCQQGLNYFAAVNVTWALHWKGDMSSAIQCVSRTIKLQTQLSYQSCLVPSKIESDHISITWAQPAPDYWHVPWRDNGHTSLYLTLGKWPGCFAGPDHPTSFP